MRPFKLLRGRPLFLMMCLSVADPLSGQTDQPCVWPEPDSTDWARQETKFFSLAVPSGFDPQEINSVDSFRNLWSSGTAELHTDYGEQGIVFGASPRGRREGEEEWTTCSSLIQGKPVQVVSFRDPDGFSVQAYFRNLENPFGQRLVDGALWGIDRGVLWIKITFQEESFRPQAMRIVKSVVFSQESDLPRSSPRAQSGPGHSTGFP